MSLHIHEDRAVPTTAAQRELVYPEDPRRDNAAFRHCADQAQ
jgi:hypothetical protein